MMPETPAPCAGKWVLFDSIDAFDHHEARAICATCPIFDWCFERAEELKKARGYCRPLTGTWAGKLYGIGGTANVTVKKERRPVASRRRIAEEDAAWTDDQARVAHNAFEAARVAGRRDDVDDQTRTGERVYQRRKKRVYYAERRAVA